MIVYASSAATLDWRSSSSARSRDRPRERSSSSVRSPPSPSMQTTLPRSGRLARTCCTLANCASSSQITAFAPELPSTHSHSRGELVG